VEEEHGGLPRGSRTWFYDVRSPVRRMAVSTHEAEGITVVSLWQGDTCTGTFRLPLGESARLISVLADGMAAGLPGRAGSGPPTERQPRWRTWLGDLMRRHGRRAGTNLWVVR
jgi:hypothetical protein